MYTDSAVDCQSEKTESGKVCQVWNRKQPYGKAAVGQQDWGSNRCLALDRHELWCYYDFPKWERCGESNCSQSNAGAEGV